MNIILNYVSGSHLRNGVQIHDPTKQLLPSRCNQLIIYFLATSWHHLGFLWCHDVDVSQEVFDSAFREHENRKYQSIQIQNMEWFLSAVRNSNDKALLCSWNRYINFIFHQFDNSLSSLSLQFSQPLQTKAVPSLPTLFFVFSFFPCPHFPYHGASKAKSNLSLKLEVHLTLAESLNHFRRLV